MEKVFISIKVPSLKHIVVLVGDISVGKTYLLMRYFLLTQGIHKVKFLNMCKARSELNLQLRKLLSKMVGWSKLNYGTQLDKRSIKRLFMRKIILNLGTFEELKEH